MQNCVSQLASNSKVALFQFWCWRLPSRSPRGCGWSSWWSWWGRPRLSSPPPPLITAGFPGSTRCVGTRGWPQSAAIIMTGRTSSPDHHVNDHDNDSDNDAKSDHERWGCRAQGREWRGHQGDPGISQQVRVIRISRTTKCIYWQFIKEQKQYVLLLSLSSPGPPLVLVYETWNEEVEWQWLYFRPSRYLSLPLTTTYFVSD